jgi:hypothetical protein
LPNTLRVVGRELASLDAESPAAPLAAADGSGFDAVCRIVEELDGVRFRELFERLPKDRAATGPEALARALALARQAEPAEDAGLPPGLAALLEPIRAAAAAGQDIGPLLEQLRSHFLEANADDAAAVDELIAKIRSRLDKLRSPEDSNDTPNKQ